MSRRGGPRDHPGLTRSGLDRSRPIGTLAAPGVRQRARSVDGDGQGYHGRPPLILDPLDPLDTLGLLRVSRGSRVSMVQGDQESQENREHPPETAPSVEDDLRTGGPWAGWGTHRSPAACGGHEAMSDSTAQRSYAAFRGPRSASLWASLSQVHAESCSELGSGRFVRPRDACTGYSARKTRFYVDL